MAEDPAMSLPRLLSAALLFALASATAEGQPPQPDRHLPYHPADADPVEPLADERGIPRTPRLSIAPSGEFTSASLDDTSLDPMDMLGVGGQVDLHVPLGAYVLVGARARFHRRSWLSPDLDGNLFSGELDAGNVTDLGLVAQLRIVNHALELGLGLGFGPTRYGWSNDDGSGSEWGYFVDPHMTLRMGRRVAFFVGIGLVVRKWPDWSMTEFGAHGELGLSFLLWSHR
jgi:hypothetical protein